MTIKEAVKEIKKFEPQPNSTIKVLLDLAKEYLSLDENLFPEEKEGMGINPNYRDGWNDAIEQCKLRHLKNMPKVEDIEYLIMNPTIHKGKTLEGKNCVVSDWDCGGIGMVNLAKAIHNLYNRLGTE